MAVSNTHLVTSPHAIGSRIVRCALIQTGGMMSPADIIQRINQDVMAALADPAVRQGMAAMDVEPRPTSVVEFRTFMDSQFAKWKEAVELSGAKAD